MPLDPESLPPLLAGPILRRVEADLVSVWIATSRPYHVCLLVFDGEDVVAGEQPEDDPRAKWLSAPQATLQVGAHLHVLTVVLDLRNPGGNTQRGAGATLAANKTYSYDLRLIDRANPDVSHNLRSLDLLGGSAPLGYEVNELPSFRTCPDELDRLVLVHGSCRQLFSVPPIGDDPSGDAIAFPPPGGWPGEKPTPESPVYTAPTDPFDNEGDEAFPTDQYPQFPKRDGMLWVDTLIAARGPGTIAQRPHQLFLTGDQIYADQPPPDILPALNHLARVLVGEEEIGADPIGASFKPATLEHFPPSFRNPIVTRSAAFTTSDGESHLLSFGEFMAYYLLTWSPTLWDLPIYPDAAIFDPAALTAPDDWRIRFLFSDEPVDPTLDPDEQFTSAFLTLRDNLPEGTLPADASPEDIAAFYFDQLRLWRTARHWSPELFEWWSRQFRTGLPRVRRALANVPTYMLADDHDISDDWYFSRQWRERVFTRPLGVDILRNGMMALTLAQAWGNDPRRWSTGPERELLEAMTTFAPAMDAAVRAGQRFPRATLDRLHELLGLPRVNPGVAPPTFRPLVEYSYGVEGPIHRVLVIDGRTKRRFPFRTSQAGGIDYEGATGLIDDQLPTGLPGEGVRGVFGDSPMAAALPPRPPGDRKMTIVVTGVPVIGPEGMESVLIPVQRFVRILSDVDAESWIYEPSTYEALLAALARYESVVILSGDVHIGYSAALDYWSAPDGGSVRTARMVQLVSSGLTKDWGSYAPALRGHALTLDVFESGTTAGLQLSERVGWGTPLRTSLTPPEPIGEIVTHPERAHPFYRARLKMPAPVLPTRGWPEGTEERQDPNWAWRAVMARDERPATMQPPNLERRWTPIDLPTDPIDQNTIGWHAKAARRLAFGRVFAVNANVGIVTFEPVGDAFQVRHVIAGEVPPMADTGNTPLGLQPYVVHQFTLAPLAADTWEHRPTIVADGGWGVDTNEPLLALLVDILPRIWMGASEFGGAVFDDIPAGMDDVTREALLTNAASRLSTSFRRRVVKELGPFALLPDGNLDSTAADAIAALKGQVGRLDVDKEARALVRPDLERLLALRQSEDSPAAIFDDLLLLACSEWVYERNPLVSTIAGALVTARSPITKQVPVLAELLAGLWDLWRNRTFADSLDSRLSILAVIPRAVLFALRLVPELVNNLIQDHDPRPSGGPPILTPELIMAGVGAWQSTRLPKRFTLVSGWEPTFSPVAPGTRATERTAETMARQTLSMLLHPGGKARHERSARSLSVTMVPPPRDGDEALRHGTLVVGWDGGVEAQFETGGRFLLRFEADGRGYHRFLWGGSRDVQARVGGGLRMTLARPLDLELMRGLRVKLTPSMSVSLGVKSGTAESSYTPSFVIRMGLNDVEDRVTFLPDDSLLVQILPTDGLTLPFDDAFEWTSERGYRFVGFGSTADAVLVDDAAPQAAPKPPASGIPPGDLDDPPNRLPNPAVVTPLTLRLGVLSVHERRLEVTTEVNDNGPAMKLTVSGTVSLNIGPVRIAISGLGASVSLRFKEVSESIDEMFDFSFGLATPTGASIAIDADVVSGGGFLQRLPAADGRTTWRGGLALRLGCCDIAAFGLIETGGNRPYSLLILLVVRFTPPLNLTLGLKLVSLGGLIALNRTMDTEALREAAVSNPGSLDLALFPDRPEQRFLEILPAIERFFPPSPGVQVVGLLAELEWRAGETGTVFGRFRLALFGRLDRVQFALYGTAQLGFPRVEDPHILRLRASLEALYDHQEQFARFSFTITEAKLFELVHLTGGAALMIRWGKKDEFALTVGGFHPSFRPYIPEGLREPPRVGAYWKPHRLVELSIQAYAAVTCTSLQFGFTAHVEVGASWGGLRGDADFNFLLMTHPKDRFELELAVRVTVFLFGADLISASLRGEIVGPRPWSIEGSVYWEVCGVSLSKDFGPHEWGDRDPDTSTVTQQASRVIGDALVDPANWSVRRQPRLPVRLRSGSNEQLDPRDQIDVRQSQLPLGIALEVHDDNRLSDPGVWSLVSGTSTVKKLGELTDVFPARRFLAKPPKESPFRGGLGAGARFGGDGWTFTPTLAIVSDEDTTEDLVLDSLPVRPPRVRDAIRFATIEALPVAMPTRAPERRWTRHLVQLEEIA